MKNLFNTQLRGYNTEDVNRFVNKANVKQQSLKNKVSELNIKNQHLEKLHAHDQSQRNSISKSLVMSEQLGQKVINKAHQQGGEYLEHAQDKGQTLVSNAKAESNSMLNNAQNKADGIVSDAKRKAKSMLSNTKQKQRILLKENLNAYRDIQNFRKDISTDLMSEAKHFSAPLWKNLDKKDRRVVAYDTINLSNQESRENILNRKPSKAMVTADNPAFLKFYPNGRIDQINVQK